MLLIHCLQKITDFSPPKTKEKLKDIQYRHVK